MNANEEKILESENTYTLDCFFVISCVKTQNIATNRNRKLSCCIATTDVIVNTPYKIRTPNLKSKKTKA